MAYTGSKAQVGIGTIFEIGTVGASPTYTVIDEATDISQSGGQNPTDDTTNLQSSALEFIPTLQNPGMFNFTMNRIAGNTAAGQLAILAAFNTQTINPYRVTLPKGTGQATTGDRYTFIALVESCNLSNIGPTKKMSYSVTIKVSGQLTNTVGS